MAWATPVDQASGHIVTTGEWNQIVDDLLFLHDMGADIASATVLATPTNQTHLVTGSTTITTIPILSAGTRLILIFRDACLVTNSFASGGNLYLRGNFGAQGNLGETLSLVSNGSFWYETSRSVNKKLDHVQITAAVTGITATTEGTAVTVITGSSILCDGSQLRIEAFVPQCTQTADAGIHFVLLRDSAVLGQARLNTGSSTLFYAPALNAVVFDTPTAASHTYALKAYTTGGTLTVQAGTGGAGALLPAFLRVTRAD